MLQRRLRHLLRNRKVVLFTACGIVLMLFFFLVIRSSKPHDTNQPCILVFGGAGYIGSHVLAELLRLQDLDYRVVVFDDLSEGYRTSLNRVEKLASHHIEFMQGDINKPEDVNRVFHKYDPLIVFHLCAKIAVGESVKDPLKYYYNNIGGTINILREMQAHGTKNFVFSSTAAVFGNPENVPIPWDAKRETINPYGFTKLAIEKALEDCAEAWGLKFVSLRYFNAAGADESGEIGEAHKHETHLIPLVLDVALGKRDKIFVFGDDYPTPDGTCIRDYIHVSDIAQAHIDSLRYLIKEKGESTFVNLGNGYGYSVMEVIQACEKVSGKTIKYEVAPRRGGDPPRLIASSKKAEEVLGWKRRYRNIEDIIRTAWRWHEKYPYGYSGKKA